jgi:hypothetical protein
VEQFLNSNHIILWEKPSTEKAFSAFQVKKLILRSSRKESVVLQIKRVAPISGVPRIGQELI